MHRDGQSGLRGMVDRITGPARLTPQDGLRFWQERTIAYILLLGVVLGVVAYVPSVVLSVAEGHFAIAVLDTVILLGAIALLVFRNLPYSLRAFAVISFTYIIGAALFYALGPFGAGPVWLFAGPVLAGILRGRKWANWALVINVFFLFFVGLHIHFGPGTPTPNALGKWMVISVNFLLLNVMTALAAARVLEGLENSLKDERQARADLDNQHKTLAAAHENLAHESEQRMRAAEALRVSEERFRRAFESIPDAVVIYNRDFEVQFMNKAARDFPWPPAGHDGQPGTPQTLSSVLAQAHRPLLEDASRTREIGGLETEIDIPGRGRRNLRISGIPLADKDGGLRELLCVTHDFTEQASLENRFRQTQKLEAIGTLAGGIAHDFNNVLGAIIGYGDLVCDALQPESTARDDMEQVLAAAERARNLVEQILTFSRRVEQARQPVELQIVVKEALRLLRPTLPSTIDIHLEIDDTCKPVLADPTQMHQVLMNLCTNAYHAMRDAGGTLTLRVEMVEVDRELARTHAELDQGLYVRLTVGDTGHGMTQDVRERIFEPFYTTKDQGEGTGLGLATVHGIVTSHSGSISVYSEPGRGTTFSIYLPCAEEIGDEQAQQIEPVTGGIERLLVVDDEDSLAALQQRVLQRYGYTVSKATDSLAALQAVRAQPHAYDLVLTDYTMPRMTGLELARELAQIRPDLPVVLISGIEVPRSELLDGGLVRAFLRKPQPTHEVARTIRAVLDANHTPS